MIPEKFKEFEAIARPVIAWLNENYHPHVTVIITPDSAEIMEGLMAFPCTDYIKD